ncbi:MAG: ClpXP protease specificity-enhancing factor SspB [Pseudomonadota bacterium]
MTTQSKIDYESLTQEAMRGVVRSVLEQIVTDGLPGDHHFYISFDTTAEGVSVSKRLKAKYPQEMTVVLQHRFWDLSVLKDRFEVKLTFDGIPERLVVPYKSIKVFFDPSVRYGLQFEEAGFTAEAIDQSLAGHDAVEADQDIETTGSVETLRPAVRLDDGATSGELSEISDEDVAAVQSEDNEPEPALADADDADGEDAAAGAEIVSLDAFRKK